MKYILILFLLIGCKSITEYGDEEIGSFPKALITFVFDDGYVSDYTVMKPLFVGQGEVACAAIVIDNIGDGGRMSSAQIIELETAGWEILSHTVTHPHLSGLTETEIRSELSTSKSILEGYGLTIKNLAYSHNDHNEIVRRVAREFYRSARAGSNSLNPQILQTYQLKSVNADDHTELAAYQTLVDSAESQLKWLIFYMHSTNAADSAMVLRLVNYIQSKNLSIVTIDEGLDLAGIKDFVNGLSRERYIWQPIQDKRIGERLVSTINSKLTTKL